MGEDRQNEVQVDSHIPTPECSQPNLTAGDFPEKIAERPEDNNQEPMVQEGPPPQFRYADELPLRHLEPALDSVAALHGAKKFRVRFADAEVNDALDRAAASGAWYVTIHFISDGQIHHFFKPSDKFPTMDTAKCATKVEEDSRRRLETLREQAEKGLAGLGLAAPETFEDQKD